MGTSHLSDLCVILTLPDIFITSFPVCRFLFYSDWDTDRRVVQCDLSGDSCRTIRDMTLTSNPNGLSYHGNRLYMVDSNFNHHVDHAHASAYNVQENTWTELTQNVSAESKKAPPFFLKWT